MKSFFSVFFLMFISSGLGVPKTLADTDKTVDSVVFSLIPQAEKLGEGVLNYFFLRVYEAELWTTSREFTFSEPFILQLTYNMSFSGEDIIDRTLSEMRQLNYPEEKIRQWGNKLGSIFPNVKKGDSIVGFHDPSRGARFFLGSRILGQVEDLEFSQAFFSIWLDSRTSEPELRNALLGLD